MSTNVIYDTDIDRKTPLAGKYIVCSIYIRCKLKHSVEKIHDPNLATDNNNLLYYQPPPVSTKKCFQTKKKIESNTSISPSNQSHVHT